jgi:tRNA-uridine 2-sulfurtransferase
MNSPVLPRKRSAVALHSGGLDSALAIHLVKRQGIAVTALHFPSFFSQMDANSKDSPVQVLAERLGVPLVLKPKGEDFLDIIRNPRYGYGKNLNPCIDCRIFSFIKAKEFMKEIGASFLVTGEVVGQRPMSQRRYIMRLIEKRSACEDIVLRPLSAKTLPPTLPELEGMVDREQLLGVTGRGRKTQFALAKEIGLVGYSPPAGGCLLTDKIFSRRVRDLLDHQIDVSVSDLLLLRVGRHVRLSPSLKLVIGRDQDENARIADLKGDGVLFTPDDFPAPSVLALGVPDRDEEVLIAGVIRRYAKESARRESIVIYDPEGKRRLIQASDVRPEEWIAERVI